MSLTHAIATILRNSSCPVEDLQDYLAEKDSRVTRAESARLIGIFENRVRQVISSLQRDQAVLAETEAELLEFAWQQAIRAGQEQATQALMHELQRRNAQSQNNQVRSSPGGHNVRLQA